MARLERLPAGSVGRHGAAGLFGGGRFGALQTVAVGNMMIQLAMTPVTTALPTIARDFGAGVTATGWLMTAYLLTLTGFMLVGGRLGDLFGHRRVLLAGILLSTVAGTLPFVVPNLAALIALRAIQGVGGALIMGNGLAILTDAFDDNQRGRAIGIVGMAASAGSLLGTLLVPLALTYLTWHWIFLVNVPLGIVGALSALSLDDENAVAGRAVSRLRGLDWLGALLLLATVTALSLSLSHLHDGPETFEAGWEWHLTMHVLAVGFLVAFVVTERRVARPIVDLRLFGNRLFTCFLIGHGILHMTMMGQFFLLPFMVERGLGLNASASSQFIAVTQVMNVFTSFFGGWLYDRTRNRSIVVVGMLAIATSMVLQGLLGGLTGYTGLLGIACLASLGMGVFQTTNNVLVMSTVPAEQRGFASGMLETVRQLGHGIGIATTGAVVTLSTGSALTTAAQSAAYVEGFRNACLMLGLLSFAAAFFSWLGIRAARAAADPGPHSLTPTLDTADREPVPAR